MTYTYDGGVATPGLAGLIEVAGTSPLIRLNSSLVTGTEPAGGTFKLDDNPLLSTPPVRVAATGFAADDGGFLSPAYLDVWTFTISGWVWLGPNGVADDIPAAQEQLKAAFSVKNGLLTLVTNMRGWAARRQILAQTNGPITFTPRFTTRRTPAMNFSIPMIAPDPVLYDADTLRSVAVTSSATAVSSAGSVPTPFKARFTGPFSTATLTAPDGTTITVDSTRLASTIGSGQYVDVQTNPTVSGGISAIRSDGTNAVAALTAFRATRITPGTANWTATGATVTLTYRDGFG